MPGVETYSRIGSRGLPWTSVRRPVAWRSGRADNQARVVPSIVSRVHSAAARASGLNQSISAPPSAAASWLPRTPSAPTSMSRATTPSGSGPYPTTSPRCQTASTLPACVRTASSATRLLWMSDRTATRIEAERSSVRSGPPGAGPSPRTAAAGPWIAWVRAGYGAGAGGDHQPVRGQAGDGDVVHLERAAPQPADRLACRGELVGEVPALPGHERPASH